MSREEFNRVIQPERFTSDAEGLMWDSWQAATSSAAAKYQARVKELELFLADWCVGTDGCMVNGNLLSRKAKELLSTSPDKALQRALLEARIDELSNYDHYHTSIARQLTDLRKQLAALEGECKHGWVCGDNQIVSGASICNKCFVIVPTSSLEVE